MESQLVVQVAGSHYKGRNIQPIEFINSNNLGFLEGNAIKYVTRHKDKGGEEDVKKAIHYLQFILEMQYGTFSEFKTEDKQICLNLES